MMTLTQIEQQLSAKYPSIITQLDEAEIATGSSWLDVSYHHEHITIEYKDKQGFGLHFDDDSYGSRPVEIYRNADKLMARLDSILMRHSKVLTLKGLRELQGVSQIELAALLGQQQASISKIEARDDILLNTLSRLVTALGGRLAISVHFDDFDVPLQCSSHS